MAGMRGLGAATDPREFLDRFLREQATLRAYLLAATGSLHEADDLLQEVSRRLWTEYARFDPDRPFRPWVLGFARLQVLKWRQSRARRRETLSAATLEALEDTSREGADEAAERRALVQGCLDKLGDWMRELLRLRYGDGLPLEDIARRLGRSFAAIGMALMRSRTALRDCVSRRMEA